MPKYLAVSVLCTLTICFAASESPADCTASWQGPLIDYTTIYEDEGGGQSFLACESGYIKSVSFFSVGSGELTCTISVKEGNLLLPQGTVQTVTIAHGWNIIELDDPLPVVQNTQYCFGIFPVETHLTLQVNPWNAFADGEHLYTHLGQNLISASLDIPFSIEITSYNPVSTSKTSWGSTKDLYR